MTKPQKLLLLAAALSIALWAIPVARYAIVESVLFYQESKKLAEISKNLGEAMVGINCSALPESEQLATRGW